MIEWFFYWYLHWKFLKWVYQIWYFIRFSSVLVRECCSYFTKFLFSISNNDRKMAITYMYIYWIIDVYFHFDLCDVIRLMCNFLFFSSPSLANKSSSQPTFIDLQRWIFEHCNNSVTMMWYFRESNIWPWLSLSLSLQIDFFLITRSDWHLFFFRVSFSSNWSIGIA